MGEDARRLLGTLDDGPRLFARRSPSADLTCAPRVATWGCWHGTPGRPARHRGWKLAWPGRWVQPIGRPAHHKRAKPRRNDREGAFMSDEHQQAQAPEQTAVAAQPNRDVRSGA